MEICHVRKFISFGVEFSSRASFILAFLNMRSEVDG